jgi:signal transduction histidine kinase
MKIDNIIDYKFVETLDLSFEKIFDDITESASEICESPISFISVLSREEQHFKSMSGLDIISGPIEESVCFMAVNSGMEYFEIEDLNDDPRTKDFLFVKGDENLKHYAGVPIKLENQKSIGALCTMDRKKKKLDEHQINTLKILAKQVSILFSLKERDKLLNDIQKKLKEKTEDLEYFVSTTSHDLKSPIRSVKSLVGLMVKNKIELFSPKGESYINLINKSSDNAFELVEDLAQHGKILSIDENNVEFDLERMLYSVNELTSKNYPNSNSKLKLNNISNIITQKTLLRTLFENLIDNAFKYSNSSEDLLIEISQERKNENLVFKVKDNGIGIPQENLKSIFKPFARLHTKNEYKGSGLGLASVERIVKKLEGSIWAESRVGLGSIFIFTIKDISWKSGSQLTKKLEYNQKN